MKTRIVIPAAQAADEEILTVTSNNVVTVIGFGFNAGADVVPIEISSDETDNNFEPCIIQGIAQELTADNNIVTVYGPGRFKVNKGVTTEVVGVSLAYEQG